MSPNVPPAHVRVESAPKTFHVFIAEDAPIDVWSAPGLTPEQPGVTFQKWTTPPKWNPVTSEWGNDVVSGEVLELTPDQLEAVKAASEREVVRIIRGKERVWQKDSGWVERDTLRTSIHATTVMRLKKDATGKDTEEREWVKNPRYAKDSRDVPVSKFIRYEPVDA